MLQLRQILVTAFPAESDLQACGVDLKAAGGRRLVLLVARHGKSGSSSRPRKHRMWSRHVAMRARSRLRLLVLPYVEATKRLTLAQALVIPFAGLPVATKNVLQEGGWVRRGLQVHNVKLSC